jgi:nucleoid DNA-binding protein
VTITKADHINQVHESNPKMTKAKAHDTVETILYLSKASLENGEDILLSGFGVIRYDCPVFSVG